MGVLSYDSVILLGEIMKNLLACLIAVFVSGCSDIYLNQEENRAFSSSTNGFRPSLLRTMGYDGTGTALGDAAVVANRLSEAYFRAAKRASRDQDIASGVVILSAAAVVAGSINNASDTALTNRALVGVTAQTVGSRGVPKTSIESILKGAKMMNCISTIATVYSASDSSVRQSPLAREVTFGAIREVRIAVRDDIVRDVAEFSAIVSAFEEALPDGVSVETSAIRMSAAESAGVRRQDLETYLKRLTGCLKDPKLEENVEK